MDIGVMSGYEKWTRMYAQLLHIGDVTMHHLDVKLDVKPVLHG